MSVNGKLTYLAKLFAEGAGEMDAGLRQERDDKLERRSGDTAALTKYTIFKKTGFGLRNG